MDEKRLRDLLGEVTADSHDEDEAFWALFYALAEDGLALPLQARALGDPVEFVDLDGASSSLGAALSLSCAKETGNTRLRSQI